MKVRSFSSPYEIVLKIVSATATVREALRFSAYLRQPASVPKEEKDDYVEGKWLNNFVGSWTNKSSSELLELLELQGM
jgi:hypothetical protein